MHDQTFYEAAAIGEVLREIMKKRGMTQAELAARCGVTQVTISRHLAGRHDTPVGLLYKVCTALGTTPAEVLNHVMTRSQHELVKVA